MISVGVVNFVVIFAFCCGALMGFAVGNHLRWWFAPPLVGAIVCGIIIGSYL